jgi:hypothetical protein
MDGQVTFSHEGVEYGADVISSENLQPPYHWILFRDPDMQKILGDDVAFIEKDGKLKSVHPALAKKNHELLQAIQSALQKHLQKR